MATGATPRPDTEVLAAAGVGARVVGNYELGERLGAGASSEVYAAKHRFLGDAVAIKILNAKIAGSPGAGADFLGEARRTRTIAHPNVVRVLDFGEAPARYLVMERLDGETLAQRVKRVGRLDEASVRAIGAAIARGAAAAHAADIVHRDLKPGNVVLVEREGEGEGGAVRPVIVDFGIARFASEAQATPTRGTPPYMAPEQLTGGAVEPAADVFALGVMLYELATGALPFGATADERRARLGRPIARVPCVSAELGATIVACLAHEAAARPAMAAVADALGGGAGGGDGAAVDDATVTLVAIPAAPARRPGRRWIVASAVVGVVVVLVLVLVLVLGSEHESTSTGPSVAPTSTSTSTSTSTTPTSPSPSPSPSPDLAHLRLAPPSASSPPSIGASQKTTTGTPPHHPKPKLRPRGETLD